MTAMRRGGSVDRFPFEISWGAFTPGLMKTFRGESGSNLPPDEFFDFDSRSVDLQPTRRTTDFSACYSETPPEGTIFDEWGIGMVPGSVEHFVAFRFHPLQRCQTPREVEEFAWPDVTEAYRYEGLAERVADYHARGYAVTGELYQTIYEMAWLLRGMESLLVDFHTDEAMAHAVCENLAQRRIVQARRYARLGVDILRLGDDVCMQQGLLLGLPVYRKFIKERTRAIIRAARDVKPDILIFMHCDGRVGDMIEEYIDIGVDILNPVQPECNDLNQIAARFGERISFWGGIGTQSTMPFGSPGDVAAAVHALAGTLGRHGGLLVAPSHILEPEVPWANVLAYVDAARQCRPLWPTARKDSRMAAMTGRQRVLSALRRQGYDRVPVKHEGTPEVNRMLMDHFGLRNSEQLLRVLGDDFRYVEAVYRGPELKTFPDGSIEGYWGERYGYIEFEGGRYLEAVHLPFADVTRVEDLDRSHFPSADWFDYSTIRSQCEALGGRYAVCFGTAGDLDFINSISRARGMEQVLMDLAGDDPVYLEIMEARFRFYYRMHERALQAAGGLIDITHVGEDLGNQRGPMIGMDIFERHFAPKLQAYFDMAHRHGAKVMMHMCGCVEKFLPRLIDLGLDIMDVVQPTTPEMDIAHLKQRYGERLCFCGSMCVQTVLPHGSADQVRSEVRRRLDLFPDGGLILGPTHAIQIGTPVENVVAMYARAGSLCDPGDEWVRQAASAEPAGDGKVNLSKLF